MLSNFFIPHNWEIVGIYLRPFRWVLGAKKDEWFFLVGQYILDQILFSKIETIFNCISHPPRGWWFYNNLLSHWGNGGHFPISTRASFPVITNFVNYNYSAKFLGICKYEMKIWKYKKTENNKNSHSPIWIT